MALGRMDLAAALLVGFVGLLRTDEILRLRFAHMLSYQGGARGVLILPDSKSGHRENKVERVVVSDPLVMAALRKAQGSQHGSSRLYAHGPNKFNEEIRWLAERVGLRTRGITGYSLRRGGATWHFATFGSLEKTATHGRWAQIKTARIYIDGALAQQAEWALSEDSRTRLALGSQVATRLLEGSPTAPGR